MSGEPTATHEAMEAVRAAWAQRWEEALACWSHFTRLSPPRWCLTFDDEQHEHIRGLNTFAMIRLTDQAVVISLPVLFTYGVTHLPLEVMAHEIGHHVYCPGDLTDQARLLARVRRRLPTYEDHAPWVANLYLDLLVNDRLQRSAGLDMANMYACIQAYNGPSSSKGWAFYMRTYEILWSLPKDSLTLVPTDDRVEGDALLASRLVRAYARDWLAGGSKFAMLMLPYLLEEHERTIIPLLARGLMDMQRPAGDGSFNLPPGLSGMDLDELDPAVHPLYDPNLNGNRPPNETNDDREPQSSTGNREPAEYEEIMKALGIDINPDDIAVAYYRERALPHLVRFPSRTAPESNEPMPEGLEQWDVGAPLEDVDWLQSIFASPRVIPGQTTLQRVWGTTEGSQPKREPLDLDLYVDTSGSMPHPRVHLSYLALAGTIMAMSALRAGASVKVTLWSDLNQFRSTPGFIRDEKEVLRMLTGFLGGATYFPIHVLRNTYAERKPEDHPVHIMIISDIDVTTLFLKDGQGNSGWDVSRMALEKARGGGTMLLNISADWHRNADLLRASTEGWDIAPVRSWEQLVDFARRFSRMKYGDDTRPVKQQPRSSSS